MFEREYLVILLNALYKFPELRAEYEAVKEQALYGAISQAEAKERVHSIARKAFDKAIGEIFEQQFLTKR